MLESTSANGYRLRLVLEQAADRVSHRIAVLDPAGVVLAELRSVEGTSADPWPASPVLQSCSLQETRPGQTAAFLVGMAGKSHWSASIEAIPQEGVLHFDFACRVHDSPRWLGTTYAIEVSEANTALFEQSENGIAVQIPAANMPAVEQSPQPLQLVCGQSSLKFPATLRWVYRISLSNRPIE